MNKPKYYKVIGSIDPKIYLNFLENFDVNWDHQFNKLHNRNNDFNNVLAFPIVDKFKEMEYYDDFIKLSDDLKEILFNNYGDGIFLKIHFSKMTKKSKVRKHTDNGLGFSLSHRIQIPLQTDKNVSFIVSNKSLVPTSGELFEINNHKPHTVKISGLSERITLIVDYMEKSIYDNFFK